MQMVNLEVAELQKQNQVLLLLAKNSYLMECTGVPNLDCGRLEIVQAHFFKS